MHLKPNSKKQVQRSKSNKKDLFPAKKRGIQPQSQVNFGIEVCAVFSL